MRYRPGEKSSLIDCQELACRASSSIASVRSDPVGYPMSEGSSPRGDAASTASGFTAASVDALDAPPLATPAGLGTLGPGATGLGHRRAASGARSSSSDFGEIEADAPPGGGPGSNNGTAAAHLPPNHRGGLHQARWLPCWQLFTSCMLLLTTSVLQLCEHSQVGGQADANSMQKDKAETGMMPCAWPCT